jgi:4-hydroxyacetophenone monooxygenase
MAIVEAQMQYVASIVRQMIGRDLGVVECRMDAYRTYSEQVDEAHANMVWTHPGMTTFFRNARGRVVVNSPWRLVDYWNRTRTANLDDYVTEPRRPAESA